MLDEFIKALMSALAVALVTGLLGLFAGSFKMWMDVRSLRKGQAASFRKIRELEEKVFGAPTSELSKSRE